MPPKLRARSTSRSRNSVNTMPTPVKTPSNTSSTGSKSPSRSRGRPKKSESTPKTARQASKSATPRKSAQSRSRSRSRGRSTVPASESASSSTSSAKKTTRTPREPKKEPVESTIELADDDDDMPTSSTPRLRARDLRTQTQSPPRARSAVVKSPPRETIPTTAAAKTASSSCSILSCVQSKTVAAYKWTDAHIRLLASFIAFVVSWPFIQAKALLVRAKPKGILANTVLFCFISLVLCVGLIFAFPAIVSYSMYLNEKYITPGFQLAEELIRYFPTYARKRWAYLSGLFKARFPQAQ